MKIFHYCPNEKKIRFFSIIKKSLRKEFNEYKSISDNNEMYINFYEHKEFINRLHSRRKLPDVAIITAHGGYNSILKADRFGGYKKVIDLQQTTVFKNDFVFAFSCSTAQLFGKNAIENGAFTYVGFDDFIGQVFEVNSNEYKRLYGFVTLIIKKVYMNSFASEFTKFIKECLSVEEFIQHFSYKINREILKLYKMNVDDINAKYKVKFVTKDMSFIKQLIKLELISKFDYFSSKMRILGDIHYIPWFFIKDQSIENLHEILEKISKMNPKNNHYKEFVKLEIYKALNDDENVKNYIDRLKKVSEISGQLTFYHEIYTKNEIAAGIEKKL